MMTVDDFLEKHAGLGRVCFFGNVDGVVECCQKLGWVTISEGEGDLLPDFHNTVIRKMAIVGPVCQDKGIFVDMPVAICCIPFEESDR